MTQTNSQFIVTPAQVANVVLTLALKKEAEYKLTPYKLGKMVYMVYAWYYALTDKKLFQNPIIIGENGPIVAEVDSQFAKYEDNIIPTAHFASTYNVDTNSTFENLDPKKQEHLEVYVTAKVILKYYKDLDDAELRDKTHEKGSVWYIATKDGNDLTVIGKAIDALDNSVAIYQAIKNRASEAIIKSNQTRSVWENK